MNGQNDLLEGMVEEALPGGNFKVRISDGSLVLAYLAGKMRLYHIKVVPGDRVLVEVSSYDKTRGRLVRRK